MLLRRNIGEKAMRILSGLVMLLAAALAGATEITPVDKVERFVNVRSGPDAGADVIGRLNRGETLTSPETIDGWYRVELPDGNVGYVHADWAVVVAAEQAAATDDGDAVETPAAATDVDAIAPAQEMPAEAPPSPDIEVSSDAEQATAETETESALVDEAAEPRVEPTPSEAVPPSQSPIRGQRDFVVRFRTETTGTSSQIYDDGNVVGIGTTAPQQRLEVNGSIQIHDQNSGIAGLMISQSSGDTGYILHNRASTLTIGAGSVDRITIDRAGNVGFAVARPEHPLQHANGAYLSAGGIWTNSSSRRLKDAIHELDAGAASAAIMALEPVSFRYRADHDDTHLGFIAEDVPDLVATHDRNGLSAMDIVAALTRVVQEQERRIVALEQALADAED